MVLSLPARGLTHGELSGHLAEVYGALVPKQTISSITDESVDTRTAVLTRVFMAPMSLDPTGKGRKRWTMRWKAPLTAFQIAFEGRLTPASL